MPKTEIQIASNHTTKYLCKSSNEEFQEELNKLYADSPKGHPPVPPAQLALATILQAYTGATDAEAIDIFKNKKNEQDELSNS